MKYRVIQHQDLEGYPICNWLIQKKSWWSGKWRFYSGFFGSRGDAEFAIKSDNIEKGIFNRPS